jgi:hypothetical protein
MARLSRGSWIPMATRTGRQGARRTASRARRAGGAGKRAADSPVIKFLGRAGFFARGVEYVVIGWIAVEIAFGHSGTQADKSGALQALGKNAAGQVALWLLAIGFIGMALWRLSEACLGTSEAGEPEQDKRKDIAKRVLAVGKAAVYGVLAWSVLEYLTGTGGTQSSDTESVDWTATLMQHPGGQVLVGLIGAVLVGVGVVLAYQAWKEKFLKSMDLSSCSRRARQAIEWLGRIGGIARGAVFVTAGIFLIVAAVDAQPGQAKGIDSALRSLAHTPAGPWLLAVVALGLIMFGLFSCCEARWRKV